MDELGPILAAVDLEEAEGALAVADAAASLACILRRDLVLMTVTPPLVARRLLRGGHQPLLEHVRGRAMLEGIAGRVRKGLPGLQVKMIQDLDPAAAIVCEGEIEGAAVIVVGTHGRSGLSRATVGSVAEEVVSTSSRPVLVLRSQGRHPIQRRLSLARILVVTDFEPPANDAVVAAGVLAAATHAHLQLVTVDKTDGRSGLKEIGADDAGPAAHHLWRTVSALREEGLDAHGWVLHGATDRGILDAEQELLPSLLVIGSHGRKGLRRLLGGSVAANVLRKAQVPVLVVREGTGLPTRIAPPEARVEARP